MTDEEQQATLASQLLRLRHALLRDGMLDAIRALGDADLSLAQLATLFLLQHRREPTIKEVSVLLGRSISATGRLLDQLVRRGLVRRDEDPRDRRVKRVAITASGLELLATLTAHRAGAQLALMRHLTTTEQAEVARGMELLTEAARRSEGDGRGGESI